MRTSLPLLVVAAAASVLALTGCSTPEPKATSESTSLSCENTKSGAAVESVSVGVSIPLSGQVEALGVDAKRGIELAKEAAERDVLRAAAGKRLERERARGVAA